MFQKIRWITERLKFYIRKRRIPWSLEWIKYFFIGLCNNPSGALKYLSRIKSRQMSYRVYFFHIFARRMLRESMEACREARIKAFMNYGTLLGCTREGDFIETDDDLDFGLMEEDVHKIDDLKRAMIKKGYAIRKDTKLEYSFSKKKYYDLYVDFWVYYKNKDGTKIYAGSLPDKKPDLACIHPYPPEIFSKFQEVTFKGIRVLMPEDAEGYNIWTYGENWRKSLSYDESKLGYLEKQSLMHPNVMRISRKDFYDNNFL